MEVLDHSDLNIKRRRFSRSEVLQMLCEAEDQTNKVTEVTEKLCSELMPDDRDTDLILDKLVHASDCLKRKINKLIREQKDRKFRWKPEILDDDWISSSQYSAFQSSEQDSEELSSQEFLGPIQSRGPYDKRSLSEDMHPKTRRRRVKSARDSFSVAAEEFGLSTTQLAGYFIHLENYGDNKPLAKVGWSLFTDGTASVVHEASVLEAVFMIERGLLSYATYQDFRLLFLDRFKLPPLYKVIEYLKTMRPDVVPYKNGVRAQLGPILSKTVTELLAKVDLSGLESSDVISFEYTYGLDGSGDHMNANQLSKTHFSTQNVMLVAFSVKNITVTQNSTGDKNVVWKSSCLGANKPRNVRPIAVFPEKETAELLTEFIPILDSEVADIAKNGVEVKTNNGETKVAKVSDSHMTMCDGKMVTNLMQLAGSYCTMCTNSQMDCHNSDVIKDGFLISRSVQSISELAISLADPVSGEIPRKKGDYSTRQGIIAKPITTADLCSNIPVCHSKIRAFEWMIDLLVRQNSCKKWSSSFKQVKYTAGEKEEMKLERSRIKAALHQELAINIGDPSDMVTGAAFKKFCSDHGRDVIVSLIYDREVQEAFREIHLGLCSVVLVLNSQKREVDVLKLKDLSTSVYLKIVETFPWCVISQSVHRILGHGWERVQMNHNMGLGDISEEGLEALNKFIRYFRERGARTTSTADNFLDTFNHLWQRSSPILHDLFREKKRRAPKMVVLRQIDTLVETIFTQEMEAD